VKKARWFLVVAWVGLTACVSPPLYNTVATYEGLTFGAGVAYQSAYRSGYWEDGWSARGTFDGPRPDIIVGYGVSEAFSIEGRFGGIISSRLNWEDYDREDSGEVHVPIPMVGVGLKISSPAENVVNTAIRMDLDFPNIAVLSPMVGVSTKTGYEFLTVGVQTAYLLLPRTLFVNIHPFKGVHIYGGADFLPLRIESGDLTLDGDSYFESFCIGIAYTHHFGKKETGY
jgi:hypothetical protein